MLHGDTITALGPKQVVLILSESTGDEFPNNHDNLLTSESDRSFSVCTAKIISSRLSKKCII